MENEMAKFNRWKEERDKRKKEEAAQKKKPFILGHASTGCFPPPPPIPKASPSRSGRAVQSQYAIYNQPRVRTKSQPVYIISSSSSSDGESTSEDLGPGLLDEDNSEEVTVDSLTIYWHTFLNQFKEKCLKWEKMARGLVLPEPAEEVVLAAVQPARLLMSRVTGQLTMLTDRCESPETDRSKVTTNDLHGFCDVMSVEIKKINGIFDKFNDMHASNWLEKVPIEPHQDKARKARCRTSIAKLATTRRWRNSIIDSVESTRQPTKTFHAGFFYVESPVREFSIPTRQSTSESSTLRKSKKPPMSMKSTMAIVRASWNGKVLAVDVIK